jgi:sensor domain CHASE-containing protein
MVARHFFVNQGVSLVDRLFQQVGHSHWAAQFGLRERGLAFRLSEGNLLFHL